MRKHDRPLARAGDVDVMPAKNRVRGKLHDTG
jgi:hypothetical protein